MDAKHVTLEESIKVDKQLLPNEVVGEKDVDPEGQYPKPNFLTIVTETCTFYQN